MHKPIKVGIQIYLNSANFNIPLKESWNKSIVAGLKVMAQEINDAHLKEDIVDIDVERVDEFAEFKAQGSIGYTTASLTNKVTGYYYIDFAYSEPTNNEEYWYNKATSFKELLNELSVYLDSVADYKLTKTIFQTDVSEEGEMELIMRAYFVKFEN